MENNNDGFTLIELMIVVAILAIIASMAVPNLLGAKLNSNETAAISTLRNIASSESQFQVTNAVDADSDGTGEYGYLAEMAGACAPRSGGMPINPPILSGRFRNLSGGKVQISGYLFWHFLPDSFGKGIGEFSTGGQDPGNPPDPNFSEIAWACYAWPSNKGISGNRVFFINHQGDILQSKNETQLYSGVTGPAPDAAFLNPTTSGSILGPLATNTTGSDGGFWKNVD